MKILSLFLAATLSINTGMVYFDEGGIGGCKTEIATAPNTQQYCMPENIYYYGDNDVQNRWRSLVRTGNVGYEDSQFLDDWVLTQQNNQYDFVNQSIGSNFSSFYNRSKTYLEGVMNGSVLRTNLAYFKYLLGNLSGEYNTPVFQEELNSIQASPYRNYYTEGESNVYNTGDTNYTSFYDNRSQTFTYNNQTYNVTNQYYNIYNNYTTYNVSNDMYITMVYNIDNTVVNIVNNGINTSYTNYFKLPDGRNSYNLTESQLKGYKTDLTVSNYQEYNNNSDLIGLFHFDGNKKNSAYYQYSQEEPRMLNVSNVLSRELRIKSINSLRSSPNSIDYTGFDYTNYNAVEYLQSSGTQYINTGYVNQTNTGRLIIDYETTTLGGLYYTQRVCGTYDGNNRFTSLYGAYSQFYVGFGSPDQALQYTMSPNTRYYINMYGSGGTIYTNINGTAVNGTYNGTNNSTYPYYVFAWNQLGTAVGQANIKLYELSLYDNDNLVRHLIPAQRISDNVLGLYDTVNSVFYTNAGTGTFIAGSIINPPSTTFIITTSVSPAGSGTVTGAGTYQNGSTVTLTATPNSGYVFNSWSDGSTQNPYSFTASSDLNITATFDTETVNYTITTSVDPVASGTVSGGGVYASGSLVTLNAIPGNGYVFSQWSDGSTQNPYSFTASSNLSITAQFISSQQYSADQLFSINPNTITYLQENSTFGAFLYVGEGNNTFTIDLTSEGNEIDFRLYPVLNYDFDLNFNNLANFTVSKGEIQGTLESTSVSENIVSYSLTKLGIDIPGNRCGLTGTLLNSGYVRVTDTGNISTSTYNHYWTCSYPVESTITNPTVEYYYDKNANAELLRFGEWNHFAIQKNGYNADIWLNGKYLGSYSLFSQANPNILTINLSSESYSYFDELRISKSYKYNNSNLVSGLSFNPPSLPYDTNVVYLLPDVEPNGTLLIQSTIPVNDWQFGGVRPSNVSLGDVYLSATDIGLLSSLQQFDGTDWIDIRGAIYNDVHNLWVSYYGYSLFTNDWSYNDLSEMNVNDIHTNTEYYGWLGAWFSKLNNNLNSGLSGIQDTLNNLNINMDVHNVNETTNNIANEYNIDINASFDSYFNQVEGNLPDLESSDYVLDHNYKQHNNIYKDLVGSTIGIFTNNGLGFMIFVPLVAGVILMIL